MSPTGAGDDALGEVLGPECFSERALQGVYQLNRTLIGLLVTIASRPASTAQYELITNLGPALVSLGSAGREQLARCPTTLVDFGFRNAELWQQIESGQPVLPSQWPSPCPFPHLQATQLAQTTLTLAWTTWQSNREAAAVIFGLAPECAASLARIGVQAIPHLAERYSQCVRPRWETDTGFWRELIRVAAISDLPAQARLPPVGIYAMQRQFAELVLNSACPATGETGTTRGNQP